MLACHIDLLTGPIDEQLNVVFMNMMQVSCSLCSRAVIMDAQPIALGMSGTVRTNLFAAKPGMVSAYCTLPALQAIERKICMETTNVLAARGEPWTSTGLEERLP